MNPKKILGFVLFFAGIVLVVNAGSGITGFVIAESVGVGVSFFLGLVFLIGGLGLMMFAEQRVGKESGLIKISQPTKKQIKAAKEMDQAITSGARLNPRQTRQLIGKAGYSTRQVRGDHEVVTWEGEDVRNPLENSRPNASVELDAGSKSYNPLSVLKRVYYDLIHRRFKDYFDSS